MQKLLGTGLMAVAKAVATAFVITLIIFPVLKAAGAPVDAAWFGQVATGHLGYARSTSEPVLTAIARRLPRSVELIFASLIIALIGGFVGAYVSARSTNRTLGRAVRGVVLALRCIPFFWLAVTLEFLIAQRGKPPTGGYGSLIPPAFTLALFQIPIIAEYFNQRFAARANRAPMLASTVLGLCVFLIMELPEIIGATIITELVFAWPGEGRLFFHALSQDDLWLATGLVLFNALLVLALRFVGQVFTARRMTTEATSDA